MATASFSWLPGVWTVPDPMPPVERLAAVLREGSGARAVGWIEETIARRVGTFAGRTERVDWRTEGF